MNQFCGMKWIKRDFSIAKTPQQNGVAKRKNRTLIEKEAYANSTNRVSTVSPSVSAVGQSFINGDDLPTDPLMPDLEDTTNLLNTGIFSGADDDEDVDAEADLNNLETTMNKVIQALADPSWVEAMQEELLQFRLQKVWTLVDLPNGKRAIGTKWVFRNKKDERGIVVRNKARLVAQGYTQEEGIDYDEVFAPVPRIEAIRLFLAYASFMGFIVYQMDVKSSFLYGTIEEEVYVCQPPCFEDPQFPAKFIRSGTIDKTLFIKKDKGDIMLVQMSSIGELTFFLGLQVKQKDDGIFISQDKYVAEILKKFDFTTVKIASTLMEPNKELIKDAEAEDVDVQFQVTPKVSHLHVVKRIFRYLKGQPKLGLWYPRDSPFDLEAFSDSDYAGASLDRKSTTGGCQFLGKRLISWQCKKQTIVANSTTEAEYVAAANCYGQIYDWCGLKKVLVMNSELKLVVVRLMLLGRIWCYWEKVSTAEPKVASLLFEHQIDGKTMVISKSSVRSNLHFNDEDGITCLPNDEIFVNLVLMGYERDSTKLTFQKAFFSPQWK
ncbi:putative ribonuclease H-like domain-containing protein [Tanacetum coccineum]